MPRSFFGGVHPRGNKKLTCDAPLVPLHPKTVTISMTQHIGTPCTPLVAIGDKVLLGQKIGDGQGLCVPVHASVSGRVIAIEPRPYASGEDVLSVVIESDGHDALSPEIRPRSDVGSLSNEELIRIIHEAGIAGMGGAGFPTDVKISSGLAKVDTLIINGAECEPYITSDDRLMRETPERVAGGIRLVKKILSPQRTAVGIEANKPEAIASMQAALGGDAELVTLRVRYPQGAEKQLIQAVTGRQVPPGGLPASVGCAMVNVATCAAIYDAVYDGMPLLRRAVTVSGSCVANPSNFLAPLGTSFADLIEAAGGTVAEPDKILCGGPMMGLAQHTAAAATIKGCNAVLCLTKKDGFTVETPHCIRCGRCIEVCPMRLMPLAMYRAERNGKLDKLRACNVTDCMECGSCAFTCPAGIPLVQSFRSAKRMLREASAVQKGGADK